MAFQKLQGTQVTPSSSDLKGRFGDWPNSYAFGGWIYNADYSAGFSDKPSEIKLNIVLDKTRTSFDIQDSDLRCDANNGDAPFYSFSLNGVPFSNYVLYSSSKKIGDKDKTLSVTFRDYSVILDKIYVGLIKKQGNSHIHDFAVRGEIPTVCQDCLLTGSTITGNASLTRNLSFGCYAGIQGKTYDLFNNIEVQESDSLESIWERALSKNNVNKHFDLDGGYLFLGADEIAQEKCGTLTEVKYSFNELIFALQKLGFKFEGTFPTTFSKGNPYYRQSYIGTLREVLNNWSSDFAMSFYCSGTTFIGIDLSKPIDITNIVSISDPTSIYGRNFTIDSSSAISNYEEEISLDNTYRQSVITAELTPRQTVTESKTTKNYVGYVPMHPLDFSLPNIEYHFWQNVFGECGTVSYPTVVNDLGFGRTIGTNGCSDYQSSSDRNRRFGVYTNRTIGDIDACIALGKYSPTLRDIYCQQRIIDSVRAGNDTDAVANFQALGFYPLLHVSNEEIKTSIIDKIKGTQEKLAIQNYSYDQANYEIFIGYQYEEIHEEIKQWESSCANQMYKIGLLRRGLLNKFPYHPGDVLDNLEPDAGLFGASGRVLTRISHSFEPPTNKYADASKAPYTDLLVYSGLYIHTGYYLAQLNNEWGTSPEDFTRDISVLNSACEQKYANAESFYEITNDLRDEYTYQTWSLEDFRPVFRDEIGDLYRQEEGLFEGLSINNPDGVDMVSIADRTREGNEQNLCRKLKIAILTDTTNNPNINLSFAFGRTRNPVMLSVFQQQEKEAWEAKQKEKTKSYCENPLLHELCENMIIASGSQFDEPSRYGCAVDPTGIYKQGFDGWTVSGLHNSRTITVNIVRNPSTFPNRPTTDENGAIYLDSLIEDELVTYETRASATIIYPIDVDPRANYNLYSGIMTTTVDMEVRSPELTEIYGEPTNMKGNNTASIRVINNNIDTDIQPIFNPYVSRFTKYVNAYTGNQSQQIVTVKQYHDLISGLNRYQAINPVKNVNLSIVGTPNSFGTFTDVLNPSNGLNSMNIRTTDQGVQTELVFADRPPVLPNQEQILNKIGPRIAGKG